MMSTTRYTTNFQCNDIIYYAQNSFDTTQKNLFLFRSKRFTSIATSFTSGRIKSL